MKHLLSVVSILIFSISISYAQAPEANEIAFEKVQQIKILDVEEQDQVVSIDPEVVEGDTVSTPPPAVRPYTPKYALDMQQIKELFPEIVYEDQLGNISMDYNSLLLLVIAEMKKQRELIEVLSKEIESLKSQN